MFTLAALLALVLVIYLSLQIVLILSVRHTAFYARFDYLWTTAFMTLLLVLNTYIFT